MAGGSPQVAIEAVMLIFTTATVMTGALLYAVGACRCGSYLRFIPYFVVGGFLAATGWFLFIGGVRMAIGHTPSLGSLPETWTSVETAKLASAVGTIMVLLALRRPRNSDVGSCRRRNCRAQGHGDWPAIANVPSEGRYHPCLDAESPR